MATISHAREALNASPLSPPPLPLVTIHEAINTPATEARYTQNSVVFSACFVSVESRDGPDTRIPVRPEAAPSLCTAMKSPKERCGATPAAAPSHTGVPASRGKRNQLPGGGHSLATAAGRRPPAGASPALRAADRRGRSSIVV